jgi:hypothetical protein
MFNLALGLFSSRCFFLIALAPSDWQRKSIDLIALFCVGWNWAVVNLCVVLIHFSTVEAEKV